MEFGLLYEVHVESPVTRDHEIAAFLGLIPQVQKAEEVGFTSVWHVEHHFLTGVSHSSNNDVILGAYAGATKHIQLGYGVKLLPFGFNHPIRAAEAVATLDQISGGRVQFGTGRGFSGVEWEGFGIDPTRTRQEWRESLGMILKCWEDEEFSWDSPNFRITPRNVVPKPVQRPHPPVWMAAVGDDGIATAGELGLGWLGFGLFAGCDEIARRVALYRSASAGCVTPMGRAKHERAAIYCLIHCAESDEIAREQSARGIEEYHGNAPRLIQSAVARIQWATEATQGKNVFPDDQRYLEETGRMLNKEITSFDFLDTNDMVIVGSPETCIKKLKRYQETGADVVLGNFQHGATFGQTLASIELFGKEVIPAFQ